MYLRHGKQSILVPGDITPETFTEIIDGDKHVQKRYTYFSQTPPDIQDDFHSTTSSQPTLKSLLTERGLPILVTPHHGLKSGFSSYLFENIKDKIFLEITFDTTHTL